MTGPFKPNILDREYDKFVQSRTRPNMPAIEVIISNPGDISGGGGSGPLQNWLCQYQETNAVVNGITTNILSHTFSAVTDSKIYSISASGGNVSTYELFIDSVLVEKKRTHFGSDMNIEFNFSFGFKVGLGSILDLKVFHTRTATSDYSATLKYAEDL